MTPRTTSSRTLVARAVLSLSSIAPIAPIAPGAGQAGDVEPSSATEVLAAARRALGWNALAGTPAALRIEGGARFVGTDAPQTLLFDGSGRFLETFEGPLSQSDGTDGRTWWVRDRTDTPRILVLGDLADAQVQQLFLTGAWSVPGDLLRFESAPRHEDDGVALDFTHADGVITGTIELDTQTWRPRSVTFGADETPSTWTFEGYREHDGFPFPDRIVFAQNGMEQRFETRSVERLATADGADFAPRIEAPGGARFDPTVPAALEVKRVRTGHLLVHPTVDGEDLGWFIFDSGAGINCIANDVTDALPEGPFGEIGARGIGGTVPARFWRAHELRLGPLTVEEPLFMGLDLTFLEPHFGVPVGGILGFELLARCVAELDMVEGAIALHDPAAYALPEGGRWEEAQLYGRHPCVLASFEDREGVFKIDTGAANDTVTLHYRVVHDLDLTKGRETTMGTAGGVGGSVGMRIGKLASFRLGGHEFSAVDAGFALEDKGAFADDYVWGNIGGKLLAPFRLVFDYPGRRIGFVPR
jgi:hypothetical protein